ncbi:MAG: hypothetical protein PHU14_01115 [Methylovulum sp.]|nr:hypothetical protein [Methylovulum sp.]
MSEAVQQQPLEDTATALVLPPPDTHSLATLLALPEAAPADFLDNPHWLRVLGDIAALAKPLVPDNEKDCENWAKALKKCAAWFNKQRNGAFRRETEALSAKAKTMMALEKQLLTIAAGYRAQFEAAQQARAHALHTQLQAAMLAAWIAKGVRPVYRTADVVALAKPSALTAKGALSGATKAALDALAHDDLMWQIRMDKRLQEVQLRCLQVGLAPFAADYIGPALHDKDDAVFSARLDALVTLDAQRMAEVVAKVQAQVLKGAAGQAPLEVLKVPAVQAPVEVLKAASPEPTPAPTTARLVGTVQINARFAITLKTAASEEALVAFFTKQLPEHLASKLVAVSVVAG